MNKVMVGFSIPDAVTWELDRLCRIAGLTPVENYHLTLGVFGSTIELDDQAGPIYTQLSNFANQEYPLIASINGVGRFYQTEDEDTDVLYASVDCSRLPDFRHRLLGSLRTIGLEPSSLHGFVPHITLAYLRTGDLTPTIHLAPFQTVFQNLLLAWGDQWMTVPLFSAVKTRQKAVSIFDLVIGGVGDS